LRQQSLKPPVRSARSGSGNACLVVAPATPVEASMPSEESTPREGRRPRHARELAGGVAENDSGGVASGSTYQCRVSPLCRPGTPNCQFDCRAPRSAPRLRRPSIKRVPNGRPDRTGRCQAKGATLWVPKMQSGPLTRTFAEPVLTAKMTCGAFLPLPCLRSC